jgi:tRNA pseudouridine38-40 synthase
MGEPLVVLTISGNAFLHSMVRTIVGSLVRVGKGQRPIGWIPEVLAVHDRAAAGETAPACGLVLWQVDY